MIRRLKMFVIFFFIISSVGIMIFFMFQIRNEMRQLTVTKKTWTNEDKLRYANTLLSKGLQREAAVMFQEYIEESTESREALATLSYQLGDIYMGLQEYEKALKAFYKAEALAPKADFKEEMNRKVVEALENLGMSSQAQYELEARTALGTPEKREGRVVARIGKREIMESEVNKSFDKLPEWMKKQFEGDKGKGEFIRQYVATEVLYGKAKKLGFDRVPEVRELVENVKKQYAVQLLIQKAVNDSVQITPKDVELYYQANKDKYREQEAVKVQFVAFKDSVEQSTALDQLKSGQGTRVSEWIQRDTTSIPGVGDVKDIVNSLLQEESGSYTAPYKLNDQFVIFFIEAKRAALPKPFAEVRKQVEYEYVMKKQQEITQMYLKKALEEQEVDIFYQPAGEKDTAVQPEVKP